MRTNIDQPTINQKHKKMESLNYSHYNGSANQEFPYWKPLITIEIIIHYAVLLPLTIFWNLTVFKALIRSKLGNKPLAVLFYSLLLVLCMDKIGQAIITATNSPDMLRFCICNVLTYSSFYSFNGFSTYFSVILITCQSLLQLQVIRGKEQWNSYRRVIFCIGVSCLSGMFWYVVIFLQPIFLPGTTNPCQPLCIQNSTSILTVEIIIIGIYAVSTLLPASATIIVTSVWSTRLFKKMSIQKNIQEYHSLNKKLLLMPILMVILIVCNGLIGFLMGVTFSEVIKLAGVDYLGNWAYFARRMSFAFISCLHGVSYPITLLYFNTDLRKNWMKHFTRRSNRVNGLRNHHSSTTTESEVQ